MTEGKEVQKWADTSMFEAEVSDATEGPKAYVLGAPSDPLGQIVACIKMYTGTTITDLATITNEERSAALEQMQKTVLAMPLEAVQIHFMLTGVHRGITHQLVRQRTAAYAQESTRFAVKRDLRTAVALPPSLMNTLGFTELAEKLREGYTAQGLSADYDDDAIISLEMNRLSPEQRRRLLWDEAVEKVGEVYNFLIDDGMPAEEARGLMPTNIVTRLNYITNLRNFLAEMGKRLSDQAQFEWRAVAAAYARALREFGKTQSYWTTISRREYDLWDQSFPKTPILERRFVGDPGDPVQVRLSSEWQYREITYAMRPVEFQKGGIAFGASFDRPSRIAERVRAFASRGIPSDEWTLPSFVHQIPAIHPDEWLLDPNSARLESGQEFDVLGNRVPVGSGLHWAGDELRYPNGKLVVMEPGDEGPVYIPEEG